MTLHHDLTGRLTTGRDVHYEVTPCSPDSSVAPVVMTISHDNGPFGLQDYFTVEEAEAVAQLLLDGVRHARDLAERETEATR